MKNKEYFESIKNGSHEQFIFKNGNVMCRCGYHKPAIFLNTMYLCPTITAYPCKY